MNAVRTIKAVLIDLSGTLHIDKKPIEGAIEGLKKLRSSGIPVILALLEFCTNTTKESTQSLLKKLNSIGFEVHHHELFTSLSACKNIILTQGLRPLLLLNDEALEDFHDVPSNGPYDSVVVGLSPSKFNYETLNQAFRILLDDKAQLIAVHKARYFAESDGLSLGPGAFVSALEYSTGKVGKIVGKPEKSFFEIAIKDLDCLDSPENVVVIGDDIHADLGGGAKELGLIRYLVRTGKYRKGDENKFEGVDGVFENFGQVVEHIIQTNK
ncbi:uncharacterized protein VTP21DRAFT_6475 [Calcarisporiella thermophila]|uniref:uncharacterized protein n=1 Tax=Calcarisporiella thermophila TaxID=911321 RepID=UPI003742C054